MKFSLFGKAAANSPTIYLSPQVLTYLKQLEKLEPTHHDELAALQDYLAKHCHGTTLPEVRWRIQQSTYTDIVGELRTEEPFPAYRILFAMPQDESWLVFLIAGNKSHGDFQGNEWYDQWVPVADAFLEYFLEQKA